MNLSQFLRCARLYSRMGWAVQEQLDDVRANNTVDVNPSAIEEMMELMDKLYMNGIDDAGDMLDFLKELHEEKREQA